jgi:DNA-directed RNA polymerase specialized sigma24 family protein
LSKPPTFEDFLHHPEVVAAIHRVLRKYGIQEQDLEDGRQEVWKKALEWKGERPTTLEGTKAFCIVVAHRHGAGEYRKKKRREKRGDAGATDLADEHIDRLIPEDVQFDRMDRQKLIALLHETVPAHEIEFFEEVAAGTPQTELAERAGGYRKVRKSLEKGRARFRNAVLVAGMGTLLVAGGWFLYLRGKPSSNEEAHPTPSASASQVLVQQQPPDKSAPTPQQDQAAELRRQAREHCAAKRWQECLDTYDKAQTLDPTGGTRDDTKLYDEAEHELMAKRIPGIAPGGGGKPAPSSK